MLEMNVKSQSQTTGHFIIGINAGLTYSNISQNGILFGYYKYALGYTIGFNADYSFGKKFTIETGLNFFENAYIHYLKANLGESYNRGEPVDLTKSYLGFEVKNRQEYIINTWLAGFKFGKSFQCIIQAGGYWGYYIQTKLHGFEYEYFDSTFYKEYPDPSIHIGYQEHNYNYTGKDFNNTIDYGIVAGCGFIFNINEKLLLVHNLRYYRGLSNTTNNKIIRNYNKFFLFSAGIKMKLNL